MKEFLNKKYTATCKDMLIGALIFSVCSTIFLYYILTDLNEDIIKIMQVILETEKALDFCLVVFPIILVISVMIALGKIVGRDKIVSGRDK